MHCAYLRCWRPSIYRHLALLLALLLSVCCRYPGSESWRRRDGAVGRAGDGDSDSDGDGYEEKDRDPRMPLMPPTRALAPAPARCDC